MSPEGQQMIDHILRLIRNPKLKIDENTPLVLSLIHI